MSCFVVAQNDTAVTIPNIVELDNVTFYEILIKCEKVHWTVKHRYSDFDKLHQQLVTEAPDFTVKLPKKRLLQNRSSTFVAKRQKDLESYVNDVFGHFKATMPMALVEFLDFQKYDIIFGLQHLANYFFLYGEQYLAKSKHYTFSVLELFSITERLKMPTSSYERSDKRYDFSHILDFCSQLEVVTIVPVKTSLPCLSYDDNSESKKIAAYAVKKPIGSSNLVPSQLKFDIGSFKRLTKLVIYGVSTENIVGIGKINETVTEVHVHKSDVSQLNQVFLCENVHRDTAIDLSDGSHKVWNGVIYANFSENQLKGIDTSIKLCPTIEKLVLDKNHIATIANLRQLHSLSHLSLVLNKIVSCADWHLELGNLVSLNLSQNQIKSLAGFRKMYSLVDLDLSANLVAEIEEVDHLGDLPCLENLRLTGNPVASCVDYRPKVMSRFGERLFEVCLDNEKCNQGEMDTALVLSAIRTAKKAASRERNA